MKQAANIQDLKLPMLLPGITVSTSADDFAPIKQMQLEKFDGNTWQLFGEVIFRVRELGRELISTQPETDRCQLHERQIV